LVAKDRRAVCLVAASQSVRIPRQPATYSDLNPATLSDAAPVGLWARRPSRKRQEFSDVAPCPQVHRRTRTGPSRWPAIDRNRWPEHIGIRTRIQKRRAEHIGGHRYHQRGGEQCQPKCAVAPSQDAFAKMRHELQFQSWLILPQLAPLPWFSGRRKGRSSANLKAPPQRAA
jgi:hypothetical protein